MLRFALRSQSEEKAALAAISRSHAIIEFDPKGKILSANENFCTTMGYGRDEVVGRHHSLFCDPDYVASPAYREFWDRLGRGEFNAGEFKRRGKSGAHVYLRASYDPVLDSRGKVVRVIKVAANVTREKLQAAEFEAQVQAISLAQAVIEFTPAGEIVTANPNFLKTMGYTLEEIKGRNHRIFVDAGYAASSDYEAFWRKLNSGELVSSSFRRIAKGGREVWLQASYNPVFDLDGHVMKVIKFANDITDLTHLAEGLARVAANDVARTIDTPFSPAFEKLRGDFNATTRNLSAALGRVSDAGEQVRNGAAEIQQASQNLARRAEGQAASLEEAAAALNEVTAAVRSAAGGAAQACEVVSEAQSDAKTSGAIVHNAVAAMGRIETSATEIGQIIGVIDEIAFQTNLLALNAGVEAARAGDAGRGFAVVASEVRALAQRSADAAKQIKTLINASSREVGDGVRLVGDAGSALQRIAERVGKLDEVVRHIAAGAEEQARSLQEVNAAVNQMDESTQQTAAVAEEMTSACASLFQETENLKAEVGRFKVGRSGETARERPGAAKPAAVRKRAA